MAGAVVSAATGVSSSELPRKNPAATAPPTTTSTIVMIPKIFHGSRPLLAGGGGSVDSAFTIV